MFRALLALSAVSLIAGSAVAHDGDDALSAWYRSLQTYGGASCCNQSDCEPVEVRLSGDHWVILRTDGSAEPVPDAVILKRENLDGRAIACHWGGELRCFVPPSGV